MKIYITLQQSEEYDSFTRLQTLLNEIGYSILGSYESRNYRTVIIEVKDIEIDALAKLEHLKESIPILEVSTSMKFYGVLNQGIMPIKVAPKLRELFKQEKYQVNIYPSHSEDGIKYVGIDIEQLNPLNVKEMSRYKQLIEQIEGIDQLIIY